jgi:hypothetical protein
MHYVILYPNLVFFVSKLMLVMLQNKLMAVRPGGLHQAGMTALSTIGIVRDGVSSIVRPNGRCLITSSSWKAAQRL